MHKNVFPMYGKEFAGTIILPCFLALCSVAGIGGSAVEIPLFEAFFDFNNRTSIALTGFCVMLCALTRYLVDFKKKHP